MSLVFSENWLVIQIFLMTSGAVTAAMARNLPPHLGQFSFVITVITKTIGIAAEAAPTPTSGLVMVRIGRTLPPPLRLRIWKLQKSLCYSVVLVYNTTTQK